MSYRKKQVAKPRQIPTQDTSNVASEAPVPTSPQTHPTPRRRGAGFWPFELRRADGTVVAAGDEWRGVTTQLAVPVGPVRLFVATASGWEPSLWFEGDGERLRPMPCRQIIARSRVCSDIAGHAGGCG